MGKTREGVSHTCRCSETGSGSICCGVQEKTPIIVFDSQAQLNESLLEWQQRLFLTDWLVVAKLEDPSDEERGELLGYNSFCLINQACVIRIAPPTEDTLSRMGRFCHELVLVHELLHCKYNWLKGTETMEATYMDTKEHALMEQMAKSLLMAKYNIPFRWFYNPDCLA